MALELVMALNAITVWALSFGITGLFIRYGSNHSPVMRYVSDSSYWFYLIHLSLTAIIPGLMAGWNIPALLKFSIVLTISVLICWITYHYFVRTTFIGKFLNGRKYSRSIKMIKSQEKLQHAS